MPARANLCRRLPGKAPGRHRVIAPDRPDTQEHVTHAYAFTRQECDSDNPVMRLPASGFNYVANAAVCIPDIINAIRFYYENIFKIWVKLNYTILLF